MKNRREKEEAFWDSCLELIPIIYICIMILVQVFLFQYGLHIEDDPLLGTKGYVRGRIAKMNFLHPIPFYMFLCLALLVPLRRGWGDFDARKENHTVDDWRFSGKKLLFLVLSDLGAVWIQFAPFYVIRDDELADRLRMTLIVAGLVLALFFYLIIRIALWRKTEYEQNLSWRTQEVCEIIIKCCVVACIASAILILILFSNIRK